MENYNSKNLVKICNMHDTERMQDEILRCQKDPTYFVKNVMGNTLKLYQDLTLRWLLEIT